MNESNRYVVCMRVVMYGILMYIIIEYSAVG